MLGWPANPHCSPYCVNKQAWGRRPEKPPPGGRVMKCQELLAALNDYLDGETQTALCQALQDHLAHCHPCRIVIDNLQHTMTLYREEEAIPLPDNLHERLTAILRQRWAARFPVASSTP